MDLLKKELERKKKSVQKAKAASGGRRFFRASELRRQHDDDDNNKDDDQDTLLQSSRKRKLLDNDASCHDDDGGDEKTGNKKRHGSSSGGGDRTTTTSNNNTGNNRDDDSAATNNNDDDGKATKKQSKTASATASKDGAENNGETTSSSSSFKMSPEEITRRLRGLGYPIKLFGESAWDRMKRLRKALDEQTNVQAGLSEMEEFRLGRGHGIRNPFLERDDDNIDNDNAGMIIEGDTTTTTTRRANNDGSALKNHNNNKKDSKNNKNKAGEAGGGHNNNNQEEEGDDNDNNNKNNESSLMDETDAPKRVYRYFKGLVKQWEDDLILRPESVKKSVAGRNETKTFKQCKDYIRPMFKLCKSRRMDESIMTKLNKIVTFCLQEEFVKAHDTYIDISIGRAAWPIGVTMVGIHARSGRAKIESSQVAHVMNSELQRKYLTSVKRLMSYAQKKSNADPSKKVL